MISTTEKFFILLLCLSFYSSKNIAFLGFIHSVHAAPDRHHIKCVEKERQALLKFKQEVVDDYNRLSSWESDEDCCKWRGVYCHNQTGNVITLNLHAPSDESGSNVQTLTGQISVSLLQLEYLEHLDLSDNYFDGSIPPFLGSFTRLTYLNLSSAGFSGKVPHELGNLSSLKTFHLYSAQGYTDNLEWLSSLQSLTTLYLGSLTFSSDWAAAVSSLPRLRVLSMSNCALPYLSPPSLDSINYSAPLDIIDFSYNTLNSSGSLFSWLINFNLTKVTLLSNNLDGPIPDGFANMVSLVHLDLSHNILEGEMLEFLNNLPRTLEYLDLDSNLISGPVPDAIVEFQSLKELRLPSNSLNGSLPKAFGELRNLTILNLSFNQIGGVLPESIGHTSLVSVDLTGNLMHGVLPGSIGQLRNLTSLYLSRNQIDGALPESIGFLTNLIILDLSENRIRVLPESIGLLTSLEELHLGSNNLEGVISQSHLQNLSSLQWLDLSFNSDLALKFHSDWIPPFQLRVLKLGNCKIGPHFPKWIQTQNNMSEIDLSTSGISDEIPSWFWDQISGVKELDLSNNMMGSSLPDLYTKVSDLVALNLSSNDFEGPIPRLPNTIQTVDLSKNRLSGEITFLCNSLLNILFYLDLSDNQLSGELFDCWANLTSLNFLSLGNNSLSGKLPNSMGSLPSIEALLLRKNNFTKELPKSLQHCEYLRFIDLGENRLSGTIPEWLGKNLSKLIVLDLSWNYFTGNISQNVCNLFQIQILDLSGNEISGRIPKCISNFSAMVEEGSPMERYFSGSSSYKAFLTWKGREAEYTWKRALKYVKSIDLSSNRLTGDIPLEVTSLIGLVALNLSRNHLTGNIPLEIGKLKSLDFLDLSRNQIFGEIPSSLSHLSLLGMLDLSYNNLTGRIPTGTQLQSFDASSYAGNLGLCGKPLPLCPGDELPPHPNLKVGDEKHKDEFIDMGFYITLVLGFIVGFWGVCGSLVLNTSWRHALFKFIDARLVTCNNS